MTHVFCLLQNSTLAYTGLFIPCKCALRVKSPAIQFFASFFRLVSGLNGKKRCIVFPLGAAKNWQRAVEKFHHNTLLYCETFVKCTRTHPVTMQREQQPTKRLISIFNLCSLHCDAPSFSFSKSARERFAPVPRTRVRPPVEHRRWKSAMGLFGLRPRRARAVCGFWRRGDKK